MIQQALLSVSDKTGIVDFARALHERGVKLLSTGGTARALREAGVPVREVGEHTGFPEILDGRVKTLVPQIHGGLLGRRDLPAHRAQMEEHGIAPVGVGWQIRGQKERYARRAPAHHDAGDLDLVAGRHVSGPPVGSALHAVL